VSDTNSGAAIQVRGLSKSFGQGPVLRDLDLALDWGESLALFGANGAGKTTLLRILSTRARPDAGTVMVAGCRLPRQAPAARGRVGVVGHSSLLYEDLTCRENLVFYGRLFRVPGLHQRVQEVLSRLGLAGQSDRRVRTLSHGQQKRLSIGRAILHNPCLLLLDEAESGLDQESLAVLRAIVEEWTTPNRAVVMTTHNRDLGSAWTERVVELSAGRLHLAGQPAMEPGR
jgi:heme ABC exporter ATP-binding subunit CcmA